MALTLNVGSGAIALVQRSSATVVETFSGNAVATLPVASTAGTCLVVIIGTAGWTFTAPVGWTALVTEANVNGNIGIWTYVNNPGGILSATWASNNVYAGFLTHISEWSNVAYVGTLLDASGVALTNGGTTITPTTTGNVLTAGDLAIAAWTQMVAAPATCTFTTPAGFTRLCDNAADSQTVHFDAEYELSPGTGAPLGPVLTSSLTTGVNAGSAFVVCLRKAPAVVDQTALVRYGSLTLKQNTADFQLVDPATVPSLGDPVAITSPTWNGRVVDVTLADITRPGDGHKLVTIAATNQTAAIATTAPGDLSDVLTGGHILLEDGSGALLLEDGSGYLLLESTTFGYRGLSVKTTQNMDGTTTTYGQVTVYETGFAAGQTFHLTSANLGYSAQAFLITNVTATLDHGANPIQPSYLIEFGSVYVTMQTAGGGVLTQLAAQPAQQYGVVMPGGTLGYAQITALQGSITTATDVTGLTITITVATGRRILISAQMNLLSTITTDAGALTIMEGATQLQQGIFPLTSQMSVQVQVILQPSAGVHTYKIQAARNAGTGTLSVNAGPTFPGWIMAQDIGT